MKYFFLVSAIIGLALAGKTPYNKDKTGSKEIQFADCFEGPNQSGNSVHFSDYVSDFADYRFDNEASSCCFYGIWLLYDEYEYNTYNLKATSFSGWGENYCTDFDATFNNKASSARFTGAPDGYKYDTLNLYEGNNFAGNEQFFYDDAGTLPIDNLGSSLIVTGCSDWTIYEYDNFQGSSACVSPADNRNCYPGFYPTIDNPYLNNRISSVKRGCYSKNILKSAAIPKLGSEHEALYVEQ